MKRNNNVDNLSALFERSDPLMGLPEPSILDVLGLEAVRDLPRFTIPPIPL
jgi:hypothetical protein